MATGTQPDLALESTAWDLGPLLGGQGEESIDGQLADAQARAEAFAGRHAGQVAALDGPGLVAAIGELTAIYELIGRAGSYASLRFSTDTADPGRGALMQKVRERSTAIETTLLFFGLEWAALDDDAAERLLAADGLDQARHYLRTERRYRPYLLSEPEEKLLTEKSVTGRAAWSRLFSEQVSAIEVGAGGAGAAGGAGGAGDAGAGGEALDVALSRLASSDREVRRATAEAVTAALAPGLRTRAYIFNTLIHDKAVNDRLRGYPTWLTSRNLANEVSDESVQALVAAVRERYDIPQRWYRLKARILGLPRLADYDRMAAVTTADEQFGWEQSRDLVLDSFGAFSPEMARQARRFFDENWIDAPVRPGKRGGAFASSAVPTVHPYVMLNFTSRRRDVLTLAHELGHGIHFSLAAKQGILQQNTPLTVAETASVFGETIVFNRLLAQTSDPEQRLALLAEAVEGAIATVFRQIAMNQFEQTVHTQRRTAGELSVDGFNEAWVASQRELLGDSVELTEGYRTWWSYVPHFIGTPGYVYAYAYGQLLALSVYQRYVEDGAAFVPHYLEMLAAGGSRSPEELGRIVGIDLADPGFWSAGLDLVEGQLQAAESAAHDAGRIAPA
ncbi:oligoendopeptidase F [Parafrankia irregularis]|uniref:Oligoendopeptidase F n=1 Tax=Parafrankia irregularis TaxID=795642 RepID=A0A0S4QGD8_9ACTN|nr:MULTISPECIES: M3 family oligoendopeptidase [Parafrankia]MBE3201036.1 M3 family oligoendopeptidase [Parafrankia sp. CH37]CUU54564.1 oligoendopeptidase F [Parafrankia irregularis]